MKEQISYDQFDKIDLRIGTVISVKKNEKARKPSLVVKVDFGKEIGIKQSSAQITHYYNEENLMNKQVIGVCNFAEKNIAGVVSQVLILGAIDQEGKVVLLHPSQKTDDGGQFCDRGDSYRTAIFATPAQRSAANKAIKQAEADLGQTIVTPVLDRTVYYLAEDYHQDYYKLDTRVLTRFGYRKQSDVYYLYRDACGRDQRVRELWGAAAPFAK